MSTKVDVTPSWSTAMDILILMIESGDDEGKALAKQELRSLAKQVDQKNAINEILTAIKKENENA